MEIVLNVFVHDFCSDDYGFTEASVDRKLPMEGTDLWLECDYNTLGDTVDVTATLLGGLELGSEHCLAVLTYSAKLTGPVTSCSSQPSEYSVLYALDMYLRNQVELMSSFHLTVICISRTTRSIQTTIMAQMRGNSTHTMITMTTAPLGREGGRGRLMSEDLKQTHS